MTPEQSVEEIAKSCIKFGVWEEELIDLPATEKAIAAALRAERERKVPPEYWITNYCMAAEIIKRLVWVPSLMAWTLSYRDVAAISTNVIMGPGVIRFIDMNAAAKGVQGE